MLEIQRRRRFRFFIRSLWGQKSFSSFHRSENKASHYGNGKDDAKISFHIQRPSQKNAGETGQNSCGKCREKICFHPHTLPAHFCNDYTRLGGKRTEAMAEVFSTGNAIIQNGAIFKLSADGRWERIWSWKGKHGAGGFSYSFCQTSLRAARGNFTVPSHSGQGTRGIFYIIVTKRLSKAGIIRFRSEAGGEFSGPALLFS